LASIRRKKLADSVIEEIKRRILSGELKEGDKLPNQNEFAAQLGVSRASLREGLHTLTLIGAIEQRPGYGTVIRASVPALYANHLTPPLMSDTEATLELVESRRFIEVGVAELAVQNATAEEIKKMGNFVEQMRQALAEKRISDYIELDLGFHYLIATSSHNRFMIHLFVTIRGFMEQFMRESFSVLPGMLERSFNFHQNIHQAIKNRDRKRAVLQMEKHIIDIQNGLEHYYQVARKGTGDSRAEG